MSGAHWLLLVVVGGLGAIARVEVGAAFTRRLRSVWQGTLAVNLLGAVLLGVVAGAGVSGDARKIAAIGGLGAFTTFSTWMVEVDRMADRRCRALLLVGALLAGLTAVWLGRLAGSLP